MTEVAALFVDPKGPYADQPGVDPWDEARDARAYPGEAPVVAHPPCARWGSLAALNEKKYGLRIGDDGGCFAAALKAVRAWGGVIEHPRQSLAWKHFGLACPPKGGGWQRASLLDPGWWTCEVNQGQYGHCGTKSTWLLCYGVSPADLPRLRWQSTPYDPDRKVVATRRKEAVQMTDAEKIHTPPEFMAVLLDIARSAR